MLGPVGAVEFNQGGSNEEEMVIKHSGTSCPACSSFVSVRYWYEQDSLLCRTRKSSVRGTDKFKIEQDVDVEEVEMV